MKNKILLIVISTIVLGVLITSCGKNEEEKQKQVPLKQLRQLEKKNYPEATAPQKAPNFRWDFSKKRVYTYSYEQDAQWKSNMGSDKSDHDMEQSVSAKGKLLVKSHGNSTADLVLKDMNMTTKMNVGKDNKHMEQEFPPFVMQGIKEDGSGKWGDSSQDLFLKLLFPIPTKSLKVGESVDVPQDMPFSAMGSLLTVKGQSRITLIKYVKIGKCTCAELDVDVDVSKLEIPPELEGKYSCSTKAKSVFYFDINNRCFVSGSTSILMQFSVDVPVPKVKLPGEDTSNMPKRTQMAMTMDTILRVSLESK